MKNVVVLGATGLVGLEVLRSLEQRDFPIKQLFLYASERSEGKTIFFKDLGTKKKVVIENQANLYNKLGVFA